MKILDVSVIVVNYNSGAIISQCLQSILQQKNVSFEIIVVDNASSDNSIEVIKKLSTNENNINLIGNQNNLGFGKANNLAFKQALGRYILLLNPDANFLADQDLEKLVSFMDQQPSLGMVGPAVIKNNKPTLPRKAYPGEKNIQKAFGDLPGKIAWIIGACMLIRSEAYRAIHGFDEDYFLYAEETDLCLRLRKNGWSIGYLEAVRVNHIGGFSENKTPSKELWQKKQNSIHLFYQKTYSPREVLKIINQELRQARLRIALLQLKKWLFLARKKDRVKLLQQQVVLESSKKFMTNFS